MKRRFRVPTGRRGILAWVALVTSLALAVSACQVDGTAQPDSVAIAAVQASSRVAATHTTASPTRPSSTALGRSSGTIEDHSTSQPRSTAPTPTSTPTSTATTPSGPIVTVVNDGYAASIMVTTIWSRALVANGVNVVVRTIEETADQIAALKRGQVDVVAQYNSGLLNYLDEKSTAIGQSAVDAAIAAKLPAGLSVLKSTPAKDDVQLTVSAATAAAYRLHSISDLGEHVEDLTLLLPEDSSAKLFANGLSNYYGLTFARTKTTDYAGAKTIAAIKSGPSVGLMDASQYQIDDNKFVVLTDPKHLFLTENFIPVIGGKKVTPAMRATLDAVSAKLSVAALRGLRKKVATGAGSFTDVADAWLASVGLK